MQFRRGSHRHMPRKYDHRELMEELNEFFINAKVHILLLPLDRPKPTVQDMDSLLNRLIEVLEEDHEELIKW